MWLEDLCSGGGIAIVCRDEGEVFGDQSGEPIGSGGEGGEEGIRRGGEEERVSTL